MMRRANLPGRWDEALLRKVCLKTGLVDPGKNPDQSFAYVDVSSVSNKSYAIEDTQELLGKDAPSRARKLIRCDDIIFATVRPTLRRIALVPAWLDGQVCSTGYCVIRPDPQRLAPTYAYYYLLTEKVAQRVEAMQKGATYPAISDDDLLSLSIPLPPLPEQRAIAHILRAVQAAREARQREVSLERERKAALMAHLFTHGTRGEPTKQTPIGEIPVSWEVKSVGELVKALQYGLSIRGETTGGYPILRMNNLEDGYVVARDMQYVDLDDGEFRKFRLKTGDILFNRTNSADLVGKSGLFSLEGDYVFASYLVRLIPDAHGVVPEYLSHFLNWDASLKRLRQLATRGVSQSNISASKLESFLVAAPPISDQQAIAGTIHACDAKIAALEREGALLDELFRALLEALMTGRVGVAGVDAADGNG